MDKIEEIAKVISRVLEDHGVYDRHTRAARAAYEVMASSDGVREALARMMEVVADIEQDGYRLTAEQIAEVRDCEAALTQSSVQPPR